jgi:hypothetical protein
LRSATKGEELRFCCIVWHMQVPIWRSRPELATDMAIVDRDWLICDTWAMDDPVSRARAALDRAEAAVIRRREELAKAVADAVRDGEKLSRVGVRARYTPEHVRRIARAHGIEDTSGREPPVRRTPPADHAAPASSNSGN